MADSLTDTYCQSFINPLKMFGLFKKDPAKQLQEQYAKLLEEARDLQRKGDIKGFAQKSAEAEEIAKKLEGFEQS